MEMAKACLKDGVPFGVCLIVEGREVGEPAVPAPVGTLARIGEWDMPQLGLLHIVAKGERQAILPHPPLADAEAPLAFRDDVQ